MAQKGKAQTALINGRKVNAGQGETILNAATRLGIKIPTLCHAPERPIEGGCRLCMVQCKDAAQPLAACHTPLESGMEIQTHHVEVEKLRRSLLMLQFETAAHTGLRWDAIREGPFSELLHLYKIAGKVPRPKYPQPIVKDHSRPMIRYTPESCINCRQCVSACDEIQGQAVFGFEGRGSQSRVVISGDRSMGESSCVSCGACIDLCPTGALTDRDRIRRLPTDEEVTITKSVCGYCSVGCRIEITSVENSINRIAGIRSATSRDGLLCQKGRFGHNFQGSWDRLSNPMIREGAGFREVSWDEAYRLTASRIEAVLSRHGPDSFGALASTRATNESSYLLQKFCRAVIGTNNIDSSARLCHASTAAALQLVTGTGAATTSYNAIEQAECIVIAGADPAISHPVAGARIRRAVLDGGTRLILIDPRRTEFADIADVFLQTKPGCDIAIFHAIARTLIQKGLTVADGTEDLQNFTNFVEEFPVKSVAQFSGVDPAVIRQAAEILGNSRGKTLFIHGLGLTQQFHGTGAVLAYLNLAVLTGSLAGQAGSGFLPLGGQNNLQGCIDLGCAPDLLPGGYPISDETARRSVEDLWGVSLPEQSGKTSRDMLAAAEDGEIRCLWVMGHDVLHSQPEETKVQKALDSLDLLIVQDLFYSDSCRHADIILPAASYLEQAGTFTNAERRIQQVRPAVPPPDQARPDWVIISRIARELGGCSWPYQDASDVLSEIAAVAPSRFGGISGKRLAENPDGLQWPCPDRTHPGTATLAGPKKMRLSQVDVPLSSEHQARDWPYLLITGRRLDQYNAGSMTRRNAGRKLSDRDQVELNPGDALRDGIDNGMRVSISSPYGATEVVAVISGSIQSGTAFLTFHFPQTHANRVIGPVSDPESGCPQFKATAVRIEPVE